jgi:hypothetical protein
MWNRFTGLLPAAMLVVTAACSPAGPGPQPLPPSETPTAAPTVPPTETQTAAPTSPPATTPESFPDPSIKVTGDEEVVYDWTNDRCEGPNVPDLASRAFRGADGQVQLILSHFDNYRMLGPELNSVKIDCHKLMESTHNADPSVYTDVEWIAAPYTEDGQTIYASVHNEYHGYDHTGQCAIIGRYTADCWYNSLTLAVSTDGGETYTHALPLPAHMYADFPYPYKPDAGPAGLRQPSNIIKAQDGFYYQFANASYYAPDQQGVCLMRTADIADPSAWRFWNGTAFDGTFIDPYTTIVAKPDEHLCPALAFDDIGASLTESVTFNTYLHRYLLLGVSADTVGAHLKWGFYYSFSYDMVHWTHRKLLMEMTLPWTAKHTDDVMYLYPSLLDPASESRNFDTSGKTAYVYYTRLNGGQGSLDRDLIRVPVEIIGPP